MKFIGRCKPELASSRDQSRPVLTCVYLDVEAQELQATDSYRLVRIPVEIEEGDTTGLIPAEAITAFGKAKSIIKRLVAGEKAVVEDGDASQTFSRPDGQFPNAKQLWPDWADKDFPATIRFGLNAKMLYDTARAMGSEEIELVVHDPLRPFILNPLRADGNYEVDRKPQALQMPIRLSSAQTEGSKPGQQEQAAEAPVEEERVRTLAVIEHGTVVRVYSERTLAITIRDEDLGGQETILLSSSWDERAA